MNLRNVKNAYACHDGKCQHTNDTDIWGISFKSDGKHYFIYSRPCGGLWVECNGDINQIMGMCQFAGKTSRSVKNAIS